MLVFVLVLVPVFILLEAELRKLPPLKQLKKAVVATAVSRDRDRDAPNSLLFLHLDDEEENDLVDDDDDDNDDDDLVGVLNR